jgi:hypothetical protein
MYDDEEDEDVHIIPTFDVREHTSARSCWCKPTDEGGGIWVHHPEEEDDGIRH